MRIGFLVRGTFHYTIELANALSRYGHEVIVFAHDALQDFVGLGSGDLKQEFQDLLDPAVSVRWVYLPARTRLGNLADNLRAIKKLTSALRTANLDILHVYDVADYRFFTAARLLPRHTKVVVTVHDAELHPGDKPSKLKFLWLENRRRADAVIVHGNDIKRRLLAGTRLSESKVHRVPHGPYSIYRRWAKGDVESDGRTVLFFGRVSIYKGLDYLIESAPLIRKAIPDVRFVLAGAGPDWPRCKALITDPDGFVIRDERVSEPDVSRLFEEADVIVLPYIEASQSGVLFIAYALGKPVVVTQVGSIPEVVDNGKTGIIVLPRNEEALANAVIRMLNDADMRRTMGKNALEKVTTGELSWDSIAVVTTKVYKQTLGLKD